LNTGRFDCLQPLLELGHFLLVVPVDLWPLRLKQFPLGLPVDFAVFLEPLQPPVEKLGLGAADVPQKAHIDFCLAALSLLDPGLNAPFTDAEHCRNVRREEAAAEGFNGGSVDDFVSEGGIAYSIARFRPSRHKRSILTGWA
jgi:hypothetical protein